MYLKSLFALKPYAITQQTRTSFCGTKIVLRNIKRYNNISNPLQRKIFTGTKYFAGSQ